MSMQQASSEHPPGIVNAVKFTPMQLALMAQSAIYDHFRKANIEAGLVRQLMVGRYVKHRTTDDIFLVTEVRMGLGGRAMLYGRKRGQPRRKATIGFLSDLDVFETGGDK